MMMVLSKIYVRFNCICDYVEVEYEEDDEELELMKKVMGFNHFDTTKVRVINMLLYIPSYKYLTMATACCLATEYVYMSFALLWVGLFVRESNKALPGCENKCTCIF